MTKLTGLCGVLALIVSMGGAFAQGTMATSSSLPKYEFVTMPSGSVVSLPYGATKICTEAPMEDPLGAALEALERAYYAADASMSQLLTRDMMVMRQILDGEGTACQADLADVIEQRRIVETAIEMIESNYQGWYNRVKEVGTLRERVRTAPPGRMFARDVHEECVRMVVDADRIERVWVQEYERLMQPVYDVLTKYNRVVWP